MANIVTLNTVNGLGNATPENVAEGVTFTSDNGIKMVGTYETINTSDATATSNDIVVGKTAYINGVKVVGTLGEIQDISKNSSSSYVSQYGSYNFSVTFDYPVLSVNSVNFYYTQSVYEANHLMPINSTTVNGKTVTVKGSCNYSDTWYAKISCKCLVL